MRRTDFKKAVFVIDEVVKLPSLPGSLAEQEVSLGLKRRKVKKLAVVVDVVYEDDTGGREMYLCPLEFENTIDDNHVKLFLQIFEHELESGKVNLKKFKKIEPVKKVPERLREKYKRYYATT